MTEIKAAITRSNAVLCDRITARRIYDELVASSDSLTPTALFNIAMMAISLGEVDKSIDLMERLETGGTWMQFWIKLLPRECSAIRENPRYQALLKRIGLDDESVKALNERMSFE